MSQAILVADAAAISFILLLQGSFCVDSSDCQVSHSCLPADSLSPNGTCVKWFSLKAGERCDDGVQCAESLRCYRNRCASKRVRNAGLGDTEVTDVIAVP